MTRRAATEPWDPDAWENHVNNLLAVHHHLSGETYARVPSRVHGDGGLEGFSTNGHVYQMYADDSGHDADARAKGQKRKIDTDLPKLELYKDFWTGMFQTTKVVQWDLVVPIFEAKEVQRHAQIKGAELKARRLSFVADSFRARVTSDIDYPVALGILKQGGIAALRLQVPKSTEDDVREYENKEPTLIATMDSKVKRLMATADDNDRVETRRDLLKQYLRSQNMLNKLKTVAKPVWETVKDHIDAFEERVAIASRFDPTSPHKRFVDTASELRAELTQAASALSSIEIECLVQGTIALWLLRCPLNFPRNTVQDHAQPRNVV